MRIRVRELYIWILALPPGAVWTWASYTLFWQPHWWKEDLMGLLEGPHRKSNFESHQWQELALDANFFHFCPVRTHISCTNRWSNSVLLVPCSLYFWKKLVFLLSLMNCFIWELCKVHFALFHFFLETQILLSRVVFIRVDQAYACSP